MTTDGVELHGVILHVSNLSRALDFYGRLLDFPVVRQTADAAFLASHSGGSAIAIHERRLQHYTDRAVQALVWHLPTIAALGQVERRLQELQASTIERTVLEDGLTLLTAKDPDGQRLLFVHAEGAEDLPTKIPPEVYWY